MLEFVVINLEYWRFGEGMLQGFKGIILVMVLLERHIFFRQVCQWSNDGHRWLQASQMVRWSNKQALQEILLDT